MAQTKSIKKKIVEALVFNRQLRQARRLLHDVEHIEPGTGLLIIPCDPYTVVGSRGDEAMITAAISDFHSRHPSGPVYFIAQGEEATKFIRRASLVSDVQIFNDWGVADPIGPIYDRACKLHPAEVVVLGADCMDGAYSPFISLQLLTLYRLIDASGIPTSLLGFSFNDHPYKFLRKAFRKLAGRPLRLRDEASRRRFVQFTGQDADLVADAAFCMKADNRFDDFAHIQKWVDEQHDAERIVIAFNFHPMLRNYSSPEDMQEDSDKVAENLAAILKEATNVSLLMLPHDDRADINDCTMLDKIYDSLKASGFELRIRYQRTVPRAAGLKAIAAIMDGVVSSRMHLAIAALGGGVPVMAADYQGKFSGLFMHFQLPQDFLLSPADFCSEKFREIFKDFMHSLPQMRATVESRLDSVLSLAAANFNHHKSSKSSSI